LCPRKTCVSARTSSPSRYGAIRSRGAGCLEAALAVALLQAFSVPFFLAAAKSGARALSLSFSLFLERERETEREREMTGCASSG
jgi:hypothetical protein